MAPSAAGMAGYYYMIGKGVPTDHRLAEKLFRQYADGGSHLGFEHLSQLARKELPGKRERKRLANSSARASAKVISN